MRLSSITADAAPTGNRIELSWAFPPDAAPTGVRVLRREDAHPTTPTDGVQVAEGVGLTSASDGDLMGETVYYYALFPYAGDPPTFDIDRHNRVSAMATSPYDFAGRLYDLLPSLYRRYDALRTAPDDLRLAPSDRDKGELRRFLELPGAQLDRLYSFARAALNLHDLDRVDGALLPLLAQWIGWRTDFTLPTSAQRNEIRFAPRLYQSVGALSSLDATVARVTGRTSQTKEYVHNVARSNDPERLALYSVSKFTGTWGAPELVSLNLAHDGRPAVITETDQHGQRSLTLFYHTVRRRRTDIWMKRLVGLGSQQGPRWLPSEPLVERPGIDKHPAAAVQGSRVWLFWQSYDPDESDADRKWRIFSRTRTGGTWSSPEVFGDPDTPRRSPTAVADDQGGVWLFWVELIAGAWLVRYNRHDGTRWQLTTPATLPGRQPLGDGTGNWAELAPSAENDLFVVFKPGQTFHLLWLFYTEHRPDRSPDNTSAVALHVKQSLDPAANDWIQKAPVPTPGLVRDRQPAAMLTRNANTQQEELQVFFVSDRQGGWTIFSTTHSLSTGTWSPPRQIVAGPYTRSAPLPAPLFEGNLLIYRSNESVAYPAGTAGGAVRTLDHRHAGSTTVSVMDTEKRVVRGSFEDFQTYTYNTGAGDHVSRNTVGVFLGPTTDDPGQADEATVRLAGVLADFTPVTARTLLITP